MIVTGKKESQSILRSGIILISRFAVATYHPHLQGGNSGIGKEIIRALLAHDAKVYLAARNAESAKTTIAELKNDTGKEAIFLSLDLSSLKSVKMAAEEFTSKERKLDILFNNG